MKIHNFGDEPEMDTEWDVLVGNRMDLEMLGYIGEITANERAMDLIAELEDKSANIQLKMCEFSYNQIAFFNIVVV